MKTLIRLLGVLYQIARNPDTQVLGLTPFDGDPENLEGFNVLDQDSFAEQLASVELPQMQERTVEARTSFEALRTTAQSTGLTADLDAAAAAQIPYLVLDHLTSARVEAMADLDGGLGDIPGQTGDGGSGDGGSGGGSGDGSGGDGGDGGGDGDGSGDGDGDGDGGDDDAIVHLDFDIDEAGVVTPVAVTASGRVPVQFVQNQTFDRRNPALDISGGGSSGGGSAPVIEAPRRVAKMVAASAWASPDDVSRGAAAGAEINDSHLSGMLNHYKSTTAAANGEAATQMTMGFYQIDAPGGGEVLKPTSSDLAISRGLVHANGKAIGTEMRRTVRAAGAEECPGHP